MSLSPEHSGLCGCWRLIAVERTTIDLTKPKDQQTQQTEIAYNVPVETPGTPGPA